MVEHRGIEREEKQVEPRKDHRRPGRAQAAYQDGQDNPIDHHRQRETVAQVFPELDGLHEQSEAVHGRPPEDDEGDEQGTHGQPRLAIREGANPSPQHRQELAP